MDGIKIRDGKGRLVGLPSAGQIVAGAFLCGISLAGGASRIDSLAQPTVRAIALIAIALGLFTNRGAFPRAFWPAAAFLGCLALLIGAQLVPLPPAVWTALPGHDFYAAAAGAAGIDQPARPVSISPDRTFSSLTALLPPIAALFLVAALPARERQFLLPLLLTLIVTGAILGLAQISGGPGSALRWYAQTSRDSTVGFFANRNHHALWLVMGIPILAAWTLSAKATHRTWQHRALAAGIAAFLLLMVVASGSRAALALSVVALLASAALVARPTFEVFRTLDSRMRWIAGVTAGVALAAFVGLSLTFGRAASVQRLIVLDAEEDGRVRFLPVVRELVDAFFPAGSGFGTFDAAFRRFEPLWALKPSYFNQAHNDILQVLIEGGLAGAVLLALFIGWWGWRTIVLWRMGPTAAVHRGRAGSIIVLLALLASVVDYPIRTALMTVTIVISCVWMLSAREAGEPAEGASEGALRAARR